ncbi:hypothetical protein KAU19_01880 [Candidatus Parcubacteria bacterium]|nr:hypothetical protein [Candidatus Parcubacteria bacterium]
MKAIVLAKNFDKFLIFVVDFPYRLSLQAFNDSSQEEAKEIALRDGNELKNFLINTTKQFEKVRISSWNELVNESYCKLLSEVKALENKDKKFSKLIEGEFTGTVASKLGESIEKRKLSKNFIMEEIAMFASLTLKGFSTRVSKYSRSKSVNYFLKTKNKNLEHIQIK